MGVLGGLPFLLIQQEGHSHSEDIELHWGVWRKWSALNRKEHSRVREKHKTPTGREPDQQREKSAGRLVQGEDRAY